MSNLKARRRALAANKVHATSHAGLWLDRYLEEQVPKKADGDKGERSKQMDTLFAPIVRGTIPCPALYTVAFERWKALVANHAELESRTATVTGRMVVGLGSESVWENSIRLHHTYGVPVIPGSALKGLASHFVAQYLGPLWNRESGAHKAMFGTTEQAGVITFYDAWYIPTPDNKLPLLEDVITVHHKDYYQGQDKPPADWDSPTPIQFLSTNGCYLITLGGVKAWRERTFKILELALEQEGIGAKTSSGYGRMQLTRA